METQSHLGGETLAQRVREEILDSLDEELEMEDEDRGSADGAVYAGAAEGEKSARRRYFKELFRLQGELIKLQDWVVNSRRKVVVIFEHRPIILPERIRHDDYIRRPVPPEMIVPEV